jgi:hypothetical protein
MSDLVRVRENGFELNVGRTHAEAAGLEVLDEPTHRPDGTLRRTTRTAGRPVKPKTTVAKSAAAKKAGAEPAETAEEANE